MEVLQNCFPRSLRRTLNELPQSLDETYERVLKEIGTANRDLARRLLQCLVVAVRPLHIEELAEVLAMDFDEAEGLTPELKEDWLLEDRQRAVLSTCSSLITLVDDGDSRVIQFSHFSVKEFLTSDRLAAFKGDVSHFAVMPEAAHTTLAQACLGVLLELDGSADIDKVESRFPLAIYAAQHWVEHAQFGMVSTRAEDGIRRLFDSTKPHLTAWIELHDIDDERPFFDDDSSSSPGPPLYYASLCGFRDLAAHIIAEHPEQVNARGGHNRSSLAAALHKKHFEVAELLYRHGGAVDVTGQFRRTPLFSASVDGLTDVARWLLDHGADANWQQPQDHSTPIIVAACRGRLGVVRTLLAHGVRVNFADDDGDTPLCLASMFGHVEIVRLLLQHGAAADISVQAQDYATPLHRTSNLAVARLLLDHGANANAKDKGGRTPLHDASSHGRIEVVRLLLDHGASADAKDKKGGTPLHEASDSEECVRLLLDRGANPDAQKMDGRSPLHEASFKGRTDIVRLLLDHGASLNAKDKKGRTPLHEASNKGQTETVRLLLDRGANADAQKLNGRSPLHEVSSQGRTETVRLLLDHGASPDAKDKKGRTPLHGASDKGKPDTVRLLLDRGADADAEGTDGWTPLHAASSAGEIDALRLLLDHGANAEAKDKLGRSPFHWLVANRGKREIIERIFTEHAASRVDKTL